MPIYIEDNALYDENDNLISDNREWIKELFRVLQQYYGVHEESIRADERHKIAKRIIAND